MRITLVHRQSARGFLRFFLFLSPHLSLSFSLLHTHKSNNNNSKNNNNGNGQSSDAKKAAAAAAVVTEDESQQSIPSQPSTKAALLLMRNCESVDTDSVGTDENSGERPNNGVDSEGQSVDDGGSVDANDDDSGGSSSMLVDDDAHLGDVAANWEEIYVQENLAAASNPAEEKIYEDLCYVTFSTNLPEVLFAKKNIIRSFCTI